MKPGQCLVCGRQVKERDMLSPLAYFCSISCAVDAGERRIDRLETGKRAARRLLTTTNDPQPD